MRKKLNIGRIAVALFAITMTAPTFAAQEAKVLKVVVDVNLSHNNYGLKSSETESEYTVTSHIYDTLLEMDSSGGIKPGLATKWEMVDPLTVRLDLRKGVTFHNGEVFDANAVKFSIEYFKDKNMFTTAMLQPISEVVVRDPHSVDVKLSRPDGSIFRKLAIWAKIFPPQYVSKVGEDNFEKHPVGTGPFTIDSVETGRKLVLKKNPRYWHNGYPSVEKIEFYYVEDPKERLKWVTDGRAHIVTNMESRDVIEIAKTNRYEVMKHPAFFVVFGIFNLEKAGTPLDDVRVRKAINYAIDRECLERLILKGNGRIVASLTMPNEIGHDASLVPYRYDLKLAKQLIKQAGYGNGFRMVIGLQPGLSRNATYCKFIKESLAKIGVDVVYDTNFNLKNISGPNRDHALPRWNGNVLLGGDPSPYMHADFIIQNFFIKKSLYRLNGDKTINQLYEKAAVSMDVANQRKLYEDIDSYIYENALAMFSHQVIRIHAVKKGVSYRPAINGLLSLRSVSFEGGAQ